MNHIILPYTPVFAFKEDGSLYIDEYIYQDTTL